MTAAGSIELIRRGWLSIVTICLVALAIGLTTVLVQRPLFQATAQIFVSSSAATNPSDLNQGADFAQRAVASYSAIATTSYVLDPVISQLRLPGTSESLAKKLTVSAPLDTSVIEISATDVDPRTSAAIADAVAGEMSRAVVRLTAGGSSGDANVVVTQVQQASGSVRQTQPRVAVTLGFALLVGLTLSIFAVLLRPVLDNRLQATTLFEEVGLNTLGNIPRRSSMSATPLVMLGAPHDPAAEAFRSLRTNLEFALATNNRNSILVTSSVSSEGKSTTAANLALALGQTGRTVALVDADLRRPRLAELFGVDGTVGLTSYLAGRSSIEEISTFTHESVTLIPSGLRPPNPSELLDTARMNALLSKLEESFDFVVVDAPPILPVTDALVLSDHVGGVVFIGGWKVVRAPSVKKSLDALNQIRAFVYGGVYTLAPGRTDGYSYQTYSGIHLQDPSRPQGGE